MVSCYWNGLVRAPFFPMVSGQADQLLVLSSNCGFCIPGFLIAGNFKWKENQSIFGNFCMSGDILSMTLVLLQMICVIVVIAYLDRKSVV